MIKNERELQITQQWLSRFEESLSCVDTYRPDEPLLQEGMRRALIEQIHELREQVDEYEAQRNSNVS